MKAANIRARRAFLLITMFLSLVDSRGAELITLDPDNYADGTVLNTVIPGLNLITAGTDNLPHPPVPFNVTARVNSLPFSAPTGDKVFAHEGVPFWNNDRRLRMDFDGLVSTISIDFMGSTPLAGQQGRLEVFGSAGQSLGVYTTQTLFGGNIETMMIHHNQADIAWAVAYTITTDSPFGRLDHLVFSQPVPVPEPGTVTLAFVAGGLLLFRLRRSHKLLE